MTTQELKQSIEKVLGNNIRCLLPSYWWKRLFNQVADRIDEVEQSTSELVVSSLEEFEKKHPSIAERTFYIIFYEDQAEQKEKNKDLFKKVVTETMASQPINPCYVASPMTGVYHKYLYCSGVQIIPEGNNLVAMGVYVVGYKKTMDIIIHEDGSTEMRDSLLGGSSVEVDTSLSTSSTNPVQNKVVTEALNNKVDKVSGKQLSTEDFTTALKTKLEGLNAFDPTEINNKVDGLQTQLNTLVNGDASTAIESFNEIIAFLNGVTDSETLDGIIASIEQQIANKQDKLVSGSNIKTLNGESILGEGNIVVNVDTSHLATKEELTSLTNEIIANEEVHAGAYNDLNTRLNELSENVQGETVTKEEFNAAIEGVNNGISAKQDVLVSGSNIKTLNGESILGEGNIVVNVDTSHLATKEELTSLTNEIIANEEVHAGAYNDLDARINEAMLEVDNKIASSITNAINASY